MIFTKKSMFSKRTNSMDIPITRKEFDEWENTPPSKRQNIHDRFPMLTADQREFLLSGTTPEEWESMWTYETNHDYDEPPF